MTLVSEAVFVLWYVGIAVKVLLCILLVRRRWIDRYPLFSLWMLLSVLRSAVLLWFHRDQGAYASFYIATQQSILILGCLGAVEAFWKLAGQLQRFVPVAAVLMVACGAVGVWVAFLTGHEGEALLDQMNRSVGIALSVGLVPAVIVFLWFAGSGIARNAFVHATVLAALFGVEAIGWMLFSAHYNIAGAFVIPGATALAFGAWCYFMRVDREQSNPPPEEPYQDVDLFK